MNESASMAGEGAAPRGDARPRRQAAGHGLPALRTVGRLLAGMEPRPSVRLWSGDPAVQGNAPFTLVVRDPWVLHRLALRRDPLGLADAYIHGDLDVEGDFYAALALKDRVQRLSMGWREKLALWRDALRVAPMIRSRGAVAQGFSHRHSRDSDRRAVAFHYDVSNDFYGLWLDTERVYSCAYFESEGDSLHEAQRRKLEHICRKLRLRAGDMFLDIGCGWGALVCWAARHHGVRAHGITLSERQLSFARQRIKEEGLDDRVSVELRDYRDLPDLEPEGRYDKIASVGMFEHVGLAQMPSYLGAVHRSLKPGGLFLNHGITHDEEGWGDSVAARFINRYVFPDGELDCVGNIQLGMERAGFEIHDVEGLRPHYAMTLRHWVRRLDEHKAAAVRQVGEATYRTWRLYMAASALEFEAGGTGVYQILASRRCRGEWPVPLTRRDLYP